MKRDRLKRSMDDLKRGIKQVVEEARAQAEETDEGAQNINVVARVNKAIATNVGEPGSVHSVSSKQRVRIRQDGQETYEESDTTKTTF